jgi:hypothetical protein
MRLERPAGNRKRPAARGARCRADKKRPAKLLSQAIRGVSAEPSD